MTREKNGGMTGDVDIDSVKDKAKAVTPVPGGVGPVTIACLLENVMKSFTEMKILINKGGLPPHG